MRQFRFLAFFAVLIAALALPAMALAHPASEGEGYCRFPDGSLTAGHCSATDHARGGHDTHIPPLPSVPPPSGPGANPPSPPSGNPPPPPSGDSPGGSGDGSSSTPVYTGIDCHITHAARPAQICSVVGGLQYWFIGADGSAQPGPFLPDSPRITRYEGTNPMTGKAVVIDYVVEGDKTLLRVSTYYPDNEYDTNKPYIFTLDPGHTVRYISW